MDCWAGVHGKGSGSRVHGEGLGLRAHAGVQADSGVVVLEVS